MREPDFHRKKLDNGITVICETRNIPVVAISTSVKYGAKYESENIKGISHFIEHLVFKGTKKRSVKEISSVIENKGGIINAFTSEEVTCFWNKLPSKYFDLGADVSRDLVLNPLLSENALERERKVILEEIKMYHDNPSYYVLEKIKEMLYQKPFNMPIAGTAKSVSHLSRDVIINTHRSIYSTNNMIFTAIGKIDIDEVLNEAIKFPKSFNQLPKVKVVPMNKDFTEERKGIDQAHFVLGFHMPCFVNKSRYAAEIFDSILGGGMSSRLFQEIREKRGLGYAVRSSLEQSKDYAYEVIYVGTVKEKIEEVKKIILKEIKKMKNLTLGDLNDAKERLIGLREVEKEKCDSTMVDLIHEELGGSAENYYKYEENINNVKLKEVKLLSKLKGFSTVSLVPH